VTIVGPGPTRAFEWVYDALKDDFLNDKVSDIVVERLEGDRVEVRVIFDFKGGA
jgi:hypothetical protein